MGALVPEYAPRSRPCGPLYALLLGTGARVNEALGITWANVDFEAAVMKGSGADTRI